MLAKCAEAQAIRRAGCVAEKLNGSALAYLHIVNPAVVGAIEKGIEPDPGALRMLELMRERYRWRFRPRHCGGLAPARQGGSDRLWAQVLSQSRLAGTVSLGRLP
jgi:hypothetical protein